MKKKYKLKKSAIIIILIFLVFLIALIIFLISLFKNKSYSLEYDIGDFRISENFDSKENLYYYEIAYNKTKYNFIYSSEYLKDKKLISDIKKYEEDNYLCLSIESSSIKNNPLCSKDDEVIDVHLVPESLQKKLNINSISEEETTYENYKIYNTDNKVLIWSYKGFNYLNKTEPEFIKLFNKDIYNMPLTTKINNYILIPDYNESYSFNKIYLLNLENLKIEDWNLEYDISFDSYALGYNDKSVFIVDKKNEIEYELVPHKKKMRILATSNKNGLIYKNGTSEEISMKKLVTTEYEFTYPNNYHYYLEDKTLYLTYLDYSIPTKISNNEVDSIVHIKEDNIYYLVKDTLYKYNLYYGEVKLIEYDDWEFNYNNLIFLNN